MGHYAGRKAEIRRWLRRKENRASGVEVFGEYVAGEVCLAGLDPIGRNRRGRRRAVVINVGGGAEDPKPISAVRGDKAPGEPAAGFDEKIVSPGIEDPRQYRRENGIAVGGDSPVRDANARPLQL